MGGIKWKSSVNHKLQLFLLVWKSGPLWNVHLGMFATKKMIDSKVQKKGIILPQSLFTINEFSAKNSTNCINTGATTNLGPKNHTYANSTWTILDH